MVLITEKGFNFAFCILKHRVHVKERLYQSFRLAHVSSFWKGKATGSIWWGVYRSHVTVGRCLGLSPACSARLYFRYGGFIPKTQKSNMTHNRLQGEEFRALWFWGLHPGQPSVIATILQVCCCSCLWVMVTNVDQGWHQDRIELWSRFFSARTKVLVK